MHGHSTNNFWTSISPERSEFKHANLNFFHDNFNQGVVDKTWQFSDKKSNWNKVAMF